MSKLKLMIVMGTRPEIIKLSEIAKKADKYFDLKIVHTGQNYDYELNKLFFEELGLREPDFYLGVVGENLGQTMGNAESEPINGTTNPFEYYFLPVSEISLDSAEHSMGVVEHNFYQRLYIRTLYNMDSGYLPSEDYMQQVARITGKYIKLNPQTQTYIQRNVKGILGGKKALGVHVRGADFKRHYKNHPSMVTVEEYIEAVHKVLRQQEYERIFLATDDSDAIVAFQREFGEKLVFYQDVIRTEGDETVMRSVVDREHHHYKLGLEVIRDMYTLAECEGIVAGLSNVSIFARIVKLSREHDFNIMHYINKGIKK